MMKVNAGWVTTRENPEWMRDVVHCRGLVSVTPRGEVGSALSMSVSGEPRTSITGAYMLSIMWLPMCTLIMAAE